jgi:hypothetical protein
MKSYFNPTLSTNLFLFLCGILLIPIFSAESDSWESGFDSIQKTKMNNIDSHLPEAHQLALKRINQYRDSMKLPLWDYDSSLSKMAQAHADYVLLNCNAGRPTGGHYENPNYPGYSKEGNEAASTSGLSGGSDPLYGLERLMEGVYHRKQFTTQKKMRVGIGFSFDPKTFCGSTLFVSRPLVNGNGDTDPEIGSTKYTLFPPNGFSDNLTHFYSEWPDPRPTKLQKSTGYLASIELTREQVANLVDTKSLVQDSSGESIPIWETNPTKPTYKNPPAGMEKVYANPKDNPFAKNFNMVFIMPKEPLKPGETYTIKTRIQYKKNEDLIEWSFKTRGNQKWLVSATEERLNSKNFFFVKNHVIEDDILQLENGNYRFDKPIWFDKSIQLIGGEKTFINFQSESIEKGYLFNFHKKGNFRIENLSFETDKIGFLYVDTETSLAIKGSNFANNPLTTFQMNHGSRVHIESSQFTSLGSPKHNIFCLRGGKPNLKDAELKLDDDNIFQEIQSNSSSCGAYPQKKNKQWIIQNNSQKGMSFTDVLALVGDGEEIFLPKGNYEFSEPRWFGERKIRIRGETGTKIQNRSTRSVFLLFQNSEIKMENLELIGACSFFTIKPKTKLLLHNVSATTTDNNCYFGTLEGDSKIEISSSNFENYFSRLFLYSHSTDAKIILHPNNKFPSMEPRFTPISGKYSR